MPLYRAMVPFQKRRSWCSKGMGGGGRALGTHFAGLGPRGTREEACIRPILIGLLLAVAWAQLLEKFRKLSRNANFAFPETRGTGFVHMLAHVSREAVDLCTKLLIYDPDERCVCVWLRGGVVVVVVVVWILIVGF